MNKRIMVDMSATLIHHGHIRLLKHAATLCDVIVGLTSDDEVYEKKGYQPELSFEQRKEILESIRWVKEVIRTPWLITETILAKHKIDFLVHGEDNANDVKTGRLVIVPRTKDISSSLLRQRAKSAFNQQKN